MSSDAYNKWKKLSLGLDDPYENSRKEPTKLQLLLQKAERRFEDARYVLNGWGGALPLPEKTKEDTILSRLEKTVLSIGIPLFFLLKTVEVLNPGADIPLLLVWFFSLILLFVGSILLSVITISIATLVDWIVRGDGRDEWEEWGDTIFTFLWNILLAPISSFLAHHKYKESLKKYYARKEAYKAVYDKCVRLIEDIKRPDAEEIFADISIEDFDSMIKLPE